MYVKVNSNRDFNITERGSGQRVYTRSDHCKKGDKTYTDIIDLDQITSGVIRFLFFTFFFLSKG